MTSVWSCGGGTDSAAIGAMIVQGTLPKPDLAVIVDTERERSSTWAYMDAVLKPRLADVGVTLERVPKSAYATVDLWGGEDGDTVLIPAYHNGGRAPGFCSNEWKSRVVHRWMREHGVVEAELWLGIALEEMRRVRVSRMSWITNRYPLIEHRMRRSDCVGLLRRLGWPDPPRSACWMCPNAGDREWKDIRDKWPEDWEKAVKLEAEIQARQPGVTLHRSGKPLLSVDFGDNQMELSNECSGMCWT